MTVIYEPSGRAAEFAHLAINHRIGCSHRCSYCYGPAVTKDPDFHNKPHDREGVLAELQKEAPKHAGTDVRVLLCFIGDPYDIINNESNLTRDVLRILKAYDIPFQILTKGGMRAVPDFDLYDRKLDCFGTTLTLLDPERARQSEPYAASPSNRIRAIEIAHKQGIETFVSLEPVLDASQSLQIIERAHEFVDHYRIGKLNHRPSDINWRLFGVRAIRLCRELGKDFYIKNDLAEHLGDFVFTNTDKRRVKREVPAKRPVKKTLFE